MSHGFLMVCLYGSCGLTCNCSVVNRHVRGHDKPDEIQPFEIALDRSARDLIGYNRHRNAAFQIQQKIFEKTRVPGRQGILNYRLKLDEKTLKRYQKQLAAFRKRKRSMIAKRLGY